MMNMPCTRHDHHTSVRTCDAYTHGGPIIVFYLPFTDLMHHIRSGCSNTAVRTYRSSQIKIGVCKHCVVLLPCVRTAQCYARTLTLPSADKPCPHAYNNSYYMIVFGSTVTYKARRDSRSGESRVFLVSGRVQRRCSIRRRIHSKWYCDGRPGCHAAASRSSGSAHNGATPAEPLPCTRRVQPLRLGPFAG